VGGPLVGLIAAWVLAAFTLATLHVSPMPKDAFGGNLATPSEVRTASGITSPDAAWLKFMERMSWQNALGNTPPNVFAADGFTAIYADRRAQFEKNEKLIVPRR
jgi:hypothetical protein